MRKCIIIISVFIWLISAPAAWADDTQIFGSPPVAMEPNVLIIFDTSGSMTGNDIPAKPYDQTKDYTSNSAGYTKDAIYRWSNTLNAWSKFLDGVGDMDQTSCEDAITELNDNGLSFIKINTSSPYDCDPNSETYDLLDLRKGNQLNYETGGYTGNYTTRTAVAKQVVKNLIDDHPNVRYGVMRFSGNDGGRLIGDGDGTGEIKDFSETRATQLKAAIDNLPASGNTPLAETLAEAGLYFAGANAYFDKSHYTQYTSPIDVYCRPNYVILMTDGDANNDDDYILDTSIYLNGKIIGDQDGDGKEADWWDADNLDDVAKFLQDEDLRSDLGNGTDKEKQNVITYTIGFTNTHPLLRDTAVNGGGMFFTASSAQALAMAFDQIIGQIETGSQIFATPSVPVSRSNGVYAGNELYLGLFKPDMSSKIWRGNLKKYELDPYFGTLLDKDGNAATDADGLFTGTATSFWTASGSPDGNEVDKGGAGATLVGRTDRKLYTFIDDDSAINSLKNARNAFSKANTILTFDMLDTADNAAKEDVIDDIHGIGKSWVMGDVLHSEPQVVYYDTDGDSDIEADDGSVIYLGTNGGVMHAFWDQGSSAQELWGFVPPGQLQKLKSLSESGNDHEYSVDGPPMVFESMGTGSVMKKYLAFGERRGGHNYYVLDITEHDKPIWRYQIAEDYLGGDTQETLGQSWGRPQFTTIAKDTTTTQEVLLLPGGYDTNEDNETITTADTKGRAAFSVKAIGGQLGKFKFFNNATSGAHSNMTHSIVDIVGVDTTGNGITNSIYAPDLGGDVFAFTDHDHNGSWQKTRLFRASPGSDLNAKRKIFYAPDVVRITGDPYPTDGNDEIASGEMIFFGTGDRADPDETAINNFFYAVKNYWWGPKGGASNPTPLKQGTGLYNATANHIVQGTAAQKATAVEQLRDRYGWYIKLKNGTELGEKIVGSPVVFAGAVYFTTYTPPSSTGVINTDDCKGEDVGAGTARLYGLDIRDGRAVHDDWSTKIEYDNETSEEVKSGGKADRIKELGHFMPSAPVIVIRDGITKLYVGADGKLIIIDPVKSVEMKMYYWRDMQP